MATSDMFLGTGVEIKYLFDICVLWEARGSWDKFFVSSQNHSGQYMCSTAGALSNTAK